MSIIIDDRAGIVLETLRQITARRHWGSFISSAQIECTDKNRKYNFVAQTQAGVTFYGKVVMRSLSEESALAIIIDLSFGRCVDEQEWGTAKFICNVNGISQES